MPLSEPSGELCIYTVQKRVKLICGAFKLPQDEAGKLNSVSGNPCTCGIISLDPTLVCLGGIQILLSVS